MAGMAGPGLSRCISYEKMVDFPAIAMLVYQRVKVIWSHPFSHGNRDFPRLCNWLAFRLHLNSVREELMELMGPLATNHLRTCAKKRIWTLPRITVTSPYKWVTGVIILLTPPKTNGWNLVTSPFWKGKSSEPNLHFGLWDPFQMAELHGIQMGGDPNYLHQLGWSSN